MLTIRFLLQRRSTAKSIFYPGRMN